MNAGPLIRELNAAGIRLQVRGDRLHVDAPTGAVTPELRQRITSNKAELIDLAGRQATRTRLLELVDRLGIDPAHVHLLPLLDVLAFDGLGDEQLRAYLSMLDDTATRQAGKVPAGHDAAILCHRCGPVLVHPGMAAVLPVVNGWPRALGCPWCFIRKAGGAIPRPRVTCASCACYRPDTINPAEAGGGCSSGHGTRYPMQRHGCGNFTPRDER